MNTRLISIIVPIYNVDKYLEQCVDSILLQTYKNIEIILVDDGSSDKSSSICDSYKAKDSRIIVIHKKNGGLVSARKAGLEIATGDYVLNIDGDDWIETTMCEELLDRAIETDADVVDSGYIEIKDDSSMLLYPYENNIYELSNSVISNELMEIWLNDQLNAIIHNTIWTKLFKKDVFVGIYSKVLNYQSYGEDMLMLIEMLNEITSFVTVDKCYYYYRVVNASLSHNKSIQKFINYNELDSVIYKKILDLYPNINKEILNYWYVNRKKGIVYSYENESVIVRNIYTISNIECIQGKIVLYGAGVVGNDYYRQLAIYNNIDIVAWVDKEPEKYKYNYCEVSKISKLDNLNYDYLLIAVAREELSESIKQELISRGISRDKIIWIKPRKKLMRFITESIE